MNKSTLALAMGAEPEPGDDDTEVGPGEPDDEGSEKTENEAIDALFDASTPEERHSAFRAAVRACMKSGY